MTIFFCFFYVFAIKYHKFRNNYCDMKGIVLLVLLSSFLAACTFWGDGGKMTSIMEEQEMLYKAKHVFETLKSDTETSELSFEAEEKRKKEQSKKEYEKILQQTNVKIEGFALPLGKPQQTGLGQPYVDISKWENRPILKNNAYILIEKLRKNRKNGTIHYYTGDTEFGRIPDVQAGDTVVIGNGNLYIKNNITIPVGIMVLNDYYDIETNLKGNRGDGKGNMIIHPDVTEITALMYASGGIMEQQWFASQTDQQTLTINGAIFTKNTIWGVKQWASVCYLPGNIETSNCQIAWEYDLRMFRRTSKGKYAVHIINNPIFQKQLPKGF